jgi:glycerol kinase
MAESYVLAIDQGTTGCTALVVDSHGSVVAQAYRELTQNYPQPGWVEHNPIEILQKSVAVMLEALQATCVAPETLHSIGITNQRETTLLWEKATGRPVHNAIVWQCRRTAEMCHALTNRGLAEQIRQKTGLPIDPYFSATKLRWLLDHVPDGQRRAEAGDLLFGTIDTWLLWNLTLGHIHATDASNASRTMLFNIRDGVWDNDLLAELRIPPQVLPYLGASSQVYGEASTLLENYRGTPIAGIAGDQQSALFGQACFRQGMAKNTYGTGSFVLLNTGRTPVSSNHGLITTIAWNLDGKLNYALEGSIFVTGAAVQWLRDGLGIIKSAPETESLATSVPDTGGVYFVPALTGLGAPHWDMYARGTLLGITRGTTKAHLARATLEAIAYETRDVLEAMTGDTNTPLKVLRVDGGGSANNFLMQFQADQLGIPIEVAATAATTALGAAYLAGIAVNVWRSQDDVAARWRSSRIFEPKMSHDERDTLYHGWKRALERARNWLQP